MKVARLAGAFFYGRATQLSLGDTLDILAPGLSLTAISLADFLDGPGFGALTRVPWAITQFSMRRHPVQIYEMLAGMGVLAVWWRVRPYRAFPGQLFLITAILYSGGRLFLDTFRANAWVSAGGYHILQIISLVIMLTAHLALMSAITRARWAGDASVQQRRDDFPPILPLRLISDLELLHLHQQEQMCVFMPITVNFKMFN